MKSRKKKAINLILLGLALKFIPLLILGLLTESLQNLSLVWYLLIIGFILAFFIVGYRFFIKGCWLYAESKGYSSNWRWLGLLSLLGLSILLIIPFQENAVFLQSLQEENLANNPFDKINITELLLALVTVIPVLSFSILAIVCLASNLIFYDLIENPSIEISLSLITAVYWAFALFTQSKKAGIVFNKIIGYKNKIDVKLILTVGIIKFAFTWGSNSLVLYNLSFVFPNYVKEFINEERFTNIPEMIARSFLTIFLAPLIEEFFFRGIVLQKWAIKWGVKTGFLASSLLFAIFHFRFDIIPLFIGGILYSILYFKSRNLMTSILCHSFYNTIVAVFYITDYFSRSAIKRSTLISVKDYQASIQPLLDQQVFLIAICVPFLVYFVYKNFPKIDAIIPYCANDAKTHETN